MPFFLIRGRHHIFDTGNEDVALRINELAHEDDEICHGLVHHAAINTRVEILGWTCDGNLVVRDASESICQCRGPRVEPVVVRLKACSKKQPGDREMGLHTIHTASTPSNQESLPFLTSARMNSSRPSEPDSSMPSKQKRRFTGRGLLSVWCASSTLIQPKMGPLSSDEPRP